MALDVQSKQVLINGANVVLRVGSASSSTKILGLVSNASYNENFQIGKANVIGHLGPVSLDPMDYSCEITIGAFVPKKGFSGTNVDLSGTQGNVDDRIPTRDTALDDGSKFAYLDFYDASAGEVIESFAGIVVSSSGKQIEGAGYARQNVQLMALKRNANAATTSSGSSGSEPEWR